MTLPPSAPARPQPDLVDQPAGPPRDPARRISPGPDRDRPWRVLSVLGGGAVLLLMLGLLAAGSVVPWALDRDIGTTAARQGLGTPAAIELRSDLADVTVVPSSAVDEVTLGLVADGSTDLPAAEAQVRARVDVSGTAADRTISVSQPVSGSPVPWASTETMDLLLLVPAEHDPELTLSADVGDVHVQGEFPRLDVQADLGDVRLDRLRTAGPLTVTADVGDVTLDEVRTEGSVSLTADLGTVQAEMAEGSTGALDVQTGTGDVRATLPADADLDLAVRADVGSVVVRAPGETRWRVDASSDTGTVDIDPDLEGGSGPAAPTMTISSDIGDITVSR